MQKSKKVYALYLTVAFFFSLFSFGKIFAFSVDSEESPTITGNIADWQTLSSTMRGTLVGTDGSSQCPQYRWHTGTYPADSTGTLAFGGSCVLFASNDYQYLFDYGGGGSAVINQDIGAVLSGQPDGNYWISFSTSEGTTRWWFPVAWQGGYAIGNGDPTEDFNTHITTWQPANESTKTNPNVTISATWLVSQTDLDSLNTFISSPANKIHFKALVRDVDCGVPSACTVNVIDYTLPTGFETSTSTTVLFDGSTFGLNYGRNYKLTLQLYGSNYYGLFGSVFNIIQHSYFSVGTTTSSGHIQQSIASSTEAELQANNFNNGYSTSACNPLSGDWHIVDCVLSLFTPDTALVGNKVGEMTGIITHSWPIGYITDFVGIISTSTVGTLTPIDAYVPPGLPGTGAHVTLSLNGVLDPFLNATTGSFINSSASSTRTLFEITNDYWKIICYLLALIYIISRVIGSHIFGHTGKYDKVKTK